MTLQERLLEAERDLYREADILRWAGVRDDIRFAAARITALEKVADENYGDLLDQSLGDWFAGQALTTMKLCNSWSDNPLYWEGVARSAYVCADAMLAERKRREGGG